MNDFSEIDFWNGIFALTNHSFYPHLTFLRDLFVVTIFTPLIIMLINKLKFLSILFVIALISFVDTSPIILRAPILLHYVLGAFIATYSINLKINSTLFITFILGSFFLLIALSIFQPLLADFPPLLSRDTFDQFFRRPICALSFFYFATLVARITRASHLCTRYLEPAIYLVFLSHSLTGQIIGTTYSKMLFLHTPPIYFLVWLSMPVVCIFAALIGTKLLKLLPKALALLTVGRSSNRQTI